ncbi:MAG: hypothetical protein M3Z92_14035 [Bacteroidota bacterium]|nr:hypothetical protein [Bacteroidota bacterium]
MVVDKVKDKFISANYNLEDAALQGYIGERMRINIEKRLLTHNLPLFLDLTCTGRENKHGSESMLENFCMQQLMRGSIPATRCSNKK